MTSTPRLRLLECAVALTVAAASCVAGPALAQKKGGSLTVGLELDIPGFDPLKVGVYDTAANIAASVLLETLVKLDNNGKPTPSLALSWSPSDDFKTWTFKLRPDVKFHDGTPFNAAAVKPPESKTPTLSGSKPGMSCSRPTVMLPPAFCA